MERLFPDAEGREDAAEDLFRVDAARDAIKGASGKANVLARLNPRTHARKGERIELVLDTHRLHFFDRDDGSGIYGAAKQAS